MFRSDIEKAIKMNSLMFFRELYIGKDEESHLAFFIVVPTHAPTLGKYCFKFDETSRNDKSFKKLIMDAGEEWVENIISTKLNGITEFTPEDCF